MTIASSGRTLATVASSGEEDDFQTPKSNKKRFLKAISSQESPQSERARSVGPETSSTRMHLKDRNVRAQSVAQLGMIGLSKLSLRKGNKK